MSGDTTTCTSKAPAAAPPRFSTVKWTGTVSPHAALFATLQTYGEVAVGLGLVLGLLTGLAAAVGLFLALNYGLATQWMTFGQQGFHVLLVTSMVLLLATRAGRVWGVDGWLLARAKHSRWLRLLA